jgi:hypothetical protein
MHDWDWTAGVMKPTSQSVQEGWPSRLLAVPAAQGLHPTAPPKEKVPAGQIVHWVCCGFEENLPGEHCCKLAVPICWELPTLGQKLPGGHGEQALSPGLDE